MHENIDSAYMYGTSNEKKIIFINVLCLVLWNQTMSADAFDGESGSWTRNWSLFPLLAIHTHCVQLIPWGLLYYEEHQSWLADTSEEELSCAVTPKKVIVHFEVLWFMNG